MIIEVGDEGDLVGRAQQRLIELGYEVSLADLRAHIYGSSTQAAVSRFQRDQKFRLVDGVVGPQTMHALDHPVTSSYLALGWRSDVELARADIVEVVKAAIGDVGLRESPDGSNDGPDLKKFRAAGQAWCARALGTWYRAATGGCPWPETASTRKIMEWAQTSGRVLAADEMAKPGDVVFIARGDVHGHVCMVVGRTPDGRLCCVGGNEGNAVRGSVRFRNSVTALIRPVPC